MQRSEVRKHVIDTLGKILVDKSLIQEQDDVLLTELELDEEDFGEFFAILQSDFRIILPDKTKTEISRLSAHSPYGQLTLQGLVDLILVQMKHRNHQ